MDSTVPSADCQGRTRAALRQVLRAGIARGVASGDDVARRLHLSRRTLNRRLKAEGTTFQRVLDEVRFELARKLLADARLPITEVSECLGYTTASAFTRAFRRWSGRSPAGWRDDTSEQRCARARTCAPITQVVRDLTARSISPPPGDPE